LAPPDAISMMCRPDDENAMMMIAIMARKEKGRFRCFRFNKQVVSVMYMLCNSTYKSDES
jgi:hypothetical protein